MSTTDRPCSRDCKIDALGRTVHAATCLVTKQAKATAATAARKWATVSRTCNVCGGRLNARGQCRDCEG